MKITTATLALGFTLLLFIGCGGENRSSSIQETKPNNGPASPMISEKEKTPPSIPKI